MLNNIKVGFYLARRQLFRNNRNSVILITAVMTLTFLNLVGISGILGGLIEGSSKAYREKYIGDLIISPLSNKKNIIDTDIVSSVLRSDPRVQAITVRYQEGASFESNYNNRDAGKRRETAQANIWGIIPSQENAVTKIGNNILEGEYLSDDDTGKIILGKNLLKKYAIAPQDEERSLGEVNLGDRILVTINGKTNEFILKGVIDGKTDVSRQAFITSGDIKRIVDQGDNRANMISVRVKNQGSEYSLKNDLDSAGFSDNQKIQTYEEGEPKFVKDIKTMFVMMGNLIGSVGIIVAAITIYIVIYINALTRRKYIGIMKGIGITPIAVELSYIFQSIFYGLLGSGVGAFIVYAFIKPYLDKNPINFPFSDGILVAPFDETFIKFAILLFITILAGYIPARSIVKQNTLAAILGR